MSNVFRIELKRARLLGQQGDVDAAQKQYFAYLRAVPHDTEVLRECGLLLMHAGKFSLARRVWRELVTALPDDAEASAQWGICLLYTQDAKKALKPLRHALSLQPDNVSIHFALAGAFGCLGRDEQALSHLQFVTHHAPDEAEGAYVEWVCALCRLERYEQALRVAKEGISIHHDSAELLFRQALCLGAMGRMHESIVSLGEALRCDADHIQALKMMARIDNSVPNTLPRFACLQRLFALLPDEGDVALDLGMMAFDQKQLDVALLASERAVLQLPNHVLALHLRAMVLRAAGHLEDACAALRRAYVLEPSNPYVLPDFGAALLATGNAKEAEDILAQALALAPSDKSTQANLNMAKKAARAAGPHLL